MPGDSLKVPPEFHADREAGFFYERRIEEALSEGQQAHQGRPDLTDGFAKRRILAANSRGFTGVAVCGHQSGRCPYPARPWMLLLLLCPRLLLLLRGFGSSAGLASIALRCRLQVRDFFSGRHQLIDFWGRRAAAC